MSVRRRQTRNSLPPPGLRESRHRRLTTFSMAVCGRPVYRCSHPVAVGLWAHMLSMWSSRIRHRVRAKRTTRKKNTIQTSMRIRSACC